MIGTRMCPECRADMPEGQDTEVCPECQSRHGATVATLAQERPAEPVAPLDLPPTAVLDSDVPPPAAPSPAGWATTSVEPPPRPERSSFSTHYTPHDARDDSVLSGFDDADEDDLGTIRYFGDYELIGEIARGGMGVVYKARQVNLNRVVALKMILGGQLASAADVQRFQIEAEAAAQLEHPNIVSIYEVGVHEGRHYFSMQLVEGTTLARRMGDYVADPRAAARLLATIARGVHAAHQRGILHRDLKPANVLLDAEGQPHITDFGLAKRVEGDSGLTQSGAIMGTPSYMSPEQASGKVKALTTATDVYSLGSILFEVLTGRPPFRGDTVMDTLRQVVEREPERPRSVKPGVDRDLETICLKCLEKDPKRRYGSAEALADDIERWLAGEPILARPCTSWERAAKWARRRPAVAALAAATVVATFAGLGVSTVQWRRAVQAQLAEKGQRVKAEDASQLAERRRREADEQRKAAERSAEQERLAKQQAQQSFEQLVQAIDEFYTKVSEEALLNAPGLQALRQDLLGRARDFYERFRRQRGDDPAGRFDYGRSVFSLASITGDLGRWGEAIGYFEEARKTFEGLGRERPDEPKYRAALAKAHNRLGVYYAATGRRPEAAAALRAALDIQAQLGDASRRDLAETYHNLGLFHAVGREPGEAEAAYKKALEIEEALDRDHPEPAHLRLLAKTLAKLGELYLDDRARWSLAQEAYGRALLARKRLAEQLPDDLQAQNDLAAGYSSVGLMHYSGPSPQPSEAEAAYAKALEVWERLERYNPAVPQYRRNLAATHNDLGVLFLSTRRFDRAEAQFREAVRVGELLARDHKDVPKYRRDLATSYANLALVQRSRGRAAEAVASSKAALDLAERLARDRPEAVEPRRDMAASYANLGLALAAAGKPDEAEAAYLKAVAVREPLATRDGAEDDDRRELGAAYYGLGLVQRTAGKPAEAEATFRRALEVRRDVARRRPGDVEAARDLAATLANLGLVYLGDRRNAKAEAAYKEALDLRERLSRDHPDEPRLLADLAGSYGDLGECAARAGRRRDAIAWYDRSVALLEDVRRRPGSPPEAASFLRDALWARAGLRAQADQPSRALDDWERAIALDPGPRRAAIRADRAVALARWGEADRAAAEADELARDPAPPEGTLPALARAYSLAARASRRPLADRYAARAVEVLARLQSEGAADLAALAADRDFDPIRDRPDFRAILARAPLRESTAPRSP
jgi:eukaryotic-like serine/threonine-protein kinase